jgi:hypothetical protein
MKSEVRGVVMTAVRGSQPPPGKKFCIACRELIPIDATVCAHCRSSQEPDKPSFSKTGLKWVASITAVVGLITGLSGIVGPLKGWWNLGRQSRSMLAAAQRQEDLGEYSAAFDTLGDILKNEPRNTQALHARLDVAMLWIEDTRVPLHNVEDYAPQAKIVFDRLTPVLEAGLGNGKDYRAADVVAHLGWLNVLKWRIVGEDGIMDAHLRRALEMDPGNVYANAMMGEFILLVHDSLDEAKAHFATALKAGHGKIFVRGCQLEGMIFNDSPGVPAELVRVANEMRKNGEPIGDGDRYRIYDSYSEAISNNDLLDVVSAVPPDDSMAMFQWVSRPESNLGPSGLLERRFIEANIDEYAGKKADALQIYRDLQKKTKDSHNMLSRRLQEALRRVSQ